MRETPHAVTVSEPQAPKRKRGRPVLISIEQITVIGDCVARGLTDEQACLSRGVNLGSFRSAIKRRPEFATAFARARAVWLDKATERIAAIGARDWQGLAWLLERRHRPQFDRGSDSSTVVNVNTLTIPQEQLERMRGIAAEHFTRPVPIPISAANTAAAR